MEIVMSNCELCDKVLTKDEEEIGEGLCIDGLYNDYPEEEYDLLKVCWYCGKVYLSRQAVDHSTCCDIPW
jgi:hypothetical protein